ncbi:hypothetical protein ACL9Z5_003619 [Acinetobacter calcoaceticus]
MTQGAYWVFACCSSFMLLQHAYADDSEISFVSQNSARFDVWSSDRDLSSLKNIGQASFWSNGTLKFNPEFKIHYDINIGDETDHTVNPDQVSKVNRNLRELYASYNWDHTFYLDVGRQIVVWGRADGINPTDNLSPRDYTRLVPEETDQRLGNDALKLTYIPESGTNKWTALWYPRSRSDVIPLRQIAGVQYDIDRKSRPAFAIRWDYSVDGLDVGASYFSGLDHMPDLSVLSASPTGGATLQLKNNPMSVYGFDFSYNHNDLVWRGEAAYTKTDSDGSEDISHKKNNLTVVMGPELSLKNSTLSLVGVYKHTEDFRSADSLTNPLLREVYRYQQTISDQYEQDQYGAMLRYALNLLNDNLKLEVTGFYFAPEPNELLRVRINYSLNDHWQLNAGGDRFWGKNDTVLGQFRDNSLVYAQIRYNF